MFIYLLLLPLIHLALVDLFVRQTYILYFALLGVSIFYLIKSKNILTMQETFLFGFYMSILSLIYQNFENLRYEIELDLGVLESSYNPDITTIYILGLLHITILLFMGYNREKIYRI